MVTLMLPTVVLPAMVPIELPVARETAPPAWKPRVGVLITEPADWVIVEPLNSPKAVPAGRVIFAATSSGPLTVPETLPITKAGVVPVDGRLLSMRQLEGVVKQVPTVGVPIKTGRFAVNGVSPTVPLDAVTE